MANCNMKSYANYENCFQTSVVMSLTKLDRAHIFLELQITDVHWISGIRWGHKTIACSIPLLNVNKEHNALFNTITQLLPFKFGLFFRCFPFCFCHRLLKFKTKSKLRVVLRKIFPSFCFHCYSNSTLNHVALCISIKITL